jgi:hypothetical protein
VVDFVFFFQSTQDGNRILFAGIDSKPESMDKLERKLIQLKIERMALKKEKDKASKERFKISNSSDDCWVSDFHAVMDFVFFFQSTQDGNRILFAGLSDYYHWIWQH